MSMALVRSVFSLSPGGIKWGSIACCSNSTTVEQPSPFSVPGKSNNVCGGGQGGTGIGEIARARAGGESADRDES